MFGHGHKRTRSKTGSRVQAWYKSARWKALRRRQLANHPLCQCPHCREGAGRLAEATEVDHVKPHRGDAKLFFDANNLQSLAKDCHDRFKQSQERGGHGFMRGSDARGWPLSKEHSFYAQRSAGRD